MAMRSRAQVGVFALAFGLETYHHHTFHGHHDHGDHADAAGHAKDDAAASAAASAKEDSIPSSMNDVMSEVRALREEVRIMRGSSEPRA